METAVEEYRRYARALAPVDPAAAQRDVRYGLDSLGPLPALLELANELGLSDDRAIPAPRVTRVAPPPAPAAPLPAGAIPGLPRRERRDEPTAAVGEPPPAPAAEASAGARAPAPAVEADEDPLDADMRAAEYIAKRDPRAAQAALVAARHFIANGHTHAASDLLLQLIASGLANHQAQRLLVEVVSSIGKRDVARAKCALLAEALRLDGQDELAMEVERLALAV